MPRNLLREHADRLRRKIDANWRITLFVAINYARDVANDDREGIQSHRRLLLEMLDEKAPALAAMYEEMTAAQAAASKWAARRRNRALDDLPF